MQIHIDKNPDELAAHAARWITVVINETLKSGDRFTIALSGGSTPQKLHKMLAADPLRTEIDWSKIHVFWGDERGVPFADERNNARMAFETLLNKVPVPKEQIHIMDTTIDAGESALKYDALLHTYFDGQPHTFDLVLLGMGDDGHTLSLFPGQPVVHEKEKWADAFFLQQQDMFRITITAPVVNKAAHVAFLAAGKGKADTLKAVLEGPYVPDTYPSQQIRPEKGELHWFVDEEAASQLKKDQSSV